MTVKSELYKALSNGSLDVREFQRRHYSLQTRRVGKDTTLIRFRDSEPWVTLDDFKCNYENKLRKDARDRVSELCNVLNPDEVMQILPEQVKAMIKDIKPSPSEYVPKATYDKVCERLFKAQDELSQCEQVMKRYCEILDRYDARRKTDLS
jgi:hypothetical protein